MVLLGAGWSEIVGEDVARNSPSRPIAGDTLLVTTRSSAWSQQLSFLAERDSWRRSARASANARIERLRFRVGKLPAHAGAAHAGEPR